jgi:hypothetical protein
LEESDQIQIWTTRYQHWNAEGRPVLFARLQYAPSFFHQRLKRIPQIGSCEAASILQEVESKAQKPVLQFYASNKRGLVMHYHRSPRYWIRAMDFEQYFKSPKRSRSVHHFRDLYFADKRYGKFIGALLNSSLFFFWFVTVGNGRNITGADVEQFPVSEVSDALLSKMPNAFDRLMRDYDNNSFIRNREDCQFQEFRPSLSKPIIDEIDEILARHYSFAPDETDFIINYDIKYRMGLGGEEAQE